MALAPGAVHASCEIYSDCSGNSCINTTMTEVGTACVSRTTTYYGFTETGNGKPQYQVDSCNTCQSGYGLVQKSVSLSPSCEPTFYACATCTGCSNCTSDTTWSSNGTGKEKLTIRTCNCNTCSTSTQYRCAAGYYGNGTTCTACPSGGTSSAGATTVGGCCATSFSDTKGSGNYNPKCCAS